MSQLFPGSYVQNTFDAIYLNSTGDAVGPGYTGTYTMDGTIPTVVVNYSGSPTILLGSGIETSTRDIVIKDGAGYLVAATGSAVINTITVSGTGGETFDGALSYTLNTNYAKVHFHNFNGASWLSV